MTKASAKPIFDGVDNFRDYGGYAARDGRWLKRDRLYRSAHHGRASEADLKTLRDLNLSAIVDLRRSEERTREPSLRSDPFLAAVIENDIEQEREDAYLSFLATSELSVPAMRDFLVQYYRDAPFEPRHMDLYARYFQALGEVDGPVLIHCAAGKDRTGILAALTHHLLGVSYADSLADYLLTNDPARIEQRLPLFRSYVSEIAGRSPSDAFLRETLGVDRLYLDTAFDTIKARYGSVDAYIEEALGVDAELKGKIEARLLD